MPSSPDAETLSSVLGPRSVHCTVGQQAASGLTVAAFCHQAGVSENSFYLWRRRLSDSPPDVQSARQVDKDDRELVPHRSDSTRTVDGSFIRIPLEFDGAPCCLEVILADATRLRVPAHHLAAWELTLQAVMNRVCSHEAEARHA